MAAACLDSRLLSDYLGGRTSGPEVIAAIEGHLSECAACQSLAAQHRPRNDSLYQALAQVATLKDASDEPELAAAMSAIAGLKPAAEVAPPTIGQASGGKFIRDYRLLEKLGEGGMGAVYLAMHTWLDKPVAVKLLKSERNQDPQAVSRFEREMRAVGKLEHPHIVRALDAGQDDGIHFLVMEYVSGVDLSRLVQQLGPLAVADACELIRQAALGLHHAHENELIHRDVKPSNLMLASGGQLKVLDLGLAQFRASMWESLNLTADNQVLGTLLYISPEQLAAGGQVDRRSDIYSLGVTLCELLLGAEPLRRGLAPAVVFRAPPKPARRDVPEGVWSLVQQMVAHEKAERPGTMHDVATALTNWTHGADLPRLASRLGSSSASPVTVSAGGSSRAKPPLPQLHTPTAITATTDVVPPPLPPSPPLVGAARRPALALVPTATVIDVPPRRLRLTTAGWIAVAMVALLALTPAIWQASSLLFGKKQVVVPTTPQMGTVAVESQGTMVDDLVERNELVAVDPEGNVTVLRAGKNQLAPARYTFQSLNGEVELTGEPSVEVKGNSTTPLPRLQVHTSPWKVPQVPEAGSLGVYEGTLWHASPEAASEDSKRLIAYGLTLEALGDEQRDDKTCRWLKVEVDNKSDPQGLRETAYVLVDLERWKKGYPFKIERGWIVARSGPIDDWLKENIADPAAEGLVAPFDSRTDTLEELAGQHGIPLFEQRIKVHDALEVVFKADLAAAAPWAKTFRASMPSQPEFHLESFPGPQGGLIPCVHISARGAPDRPAADAKLPDVLPEEGVLPQLAFNVWRSSTVPFNFVELKAQSADFEATMKLTSHMVDRVGRQSLPPEDSLARLAASIGKFSGSKLSFDRAAFPKQDFHEVKHLVTIKVATLNLTYDVRIRCVGTEPRGDDVYRWLEVEVVQTGETQHEELARVLVNESKYVREGELTIERGWLVVEDETFAIDPAGSIDAASKGLRKLGKELPSSPLGKPVFGAHAVLALMFNARLEASSHFESLRARFSELGPLRKPELGAKIKRRNGQTIPGRIYSLQSDELSYEFQKTTNQHVPFEFVRVELDAQIKIPLVKDMPVEFCIEEDGVRHDAMSSLPAEAEIEVREADTQRRIEAAYGKNWRHWTIATDPPKVLWAEYCGTLGSIVVLRDDDQVFQPLLDELSDEDRAHAKAGRWWHDKNGVPVTFKDDPTPLRGEFDRLSTGSLTDASFVRISSGGNVDRAAVGGKYLAYKDFSQEDQAAIKELDHRKRPNP